MKDFFNAYKNISALSAQLICSGTKLALGMLLVGIFVYNYNDGIVECYKCGELALQIIQKAWNLFVIIVLGGLLLDCYDKSK